MKSLHASAIRTRVRLVPPRLALAGFALAGLAGGCALPQLDVMPRYGLLDLSGEYGASNTDVGAGADLEEMGLEELEPAPGARADFKWGGPHLILSGFQSEHEGSGTLTAELSRGPFVLGAGTEVESELDLGLYSAFLLFDLVPGATVGAALGIGAAAVDFDASVRDALGTTVASDETVWLPMLAANLGLNVGSLEAALLVGGFQWSDDEDEIRYFDADAFLRWGFLGGDDHLRASLVVGWRQLALDFEVDDDEGETTGDFDGYGPYLGLELTL